MLGAPRLSLTPPSAAARRALGLSIHGDQVALGQSQGEVAARPQQLAHLLAELVTESGWTWQGVFFNGQKSCR
ncbi:hypothetical protein [Comamonas flocculans]|uniref:Uncharacterized protein n=1 Tax=Comamonas flocculans TaxID=2597701 RepID=A0A5B8RTM0_9BURK|nr:hypothetical protein [Comamonas flocculans]QEA12841.1 hypothetical protein FOZ74_07265 [Comamonas flocculans]